MIETIECSSPEQFAGALSEAESRADDKPLFVLFYGQKSKSSGLSWCGDCVAAEPIIESALSAIEGGCVLLSCSVEREAYRSSEYSYRLNPAIKLACVPTLMKWRNGKSIARLNDSQSQIAELVQELVDA